MVSVCALGYNYGTFFEENLLHKNISQEVQKTDHEFHSISFVLPTFTCLPDNFQNHIYFQSIGFILYLK